MIVSPRAEPIIDVLRKEGNGFIPIDEVFLYRRAGAGSPYRKIIYWKRGEDSINPPQQVVRIERLFIGNGARMLLTRRNRSYALLLLYRK